MDKVKDQLSVKPPALDEVKGAILNMGGEIAESSSKVVDTIQNEIGKAASAEEIKKVIAAAQEKIEEATTGVTDGFKKVGDKLQNIFDFIKDKKNDLTDNTLTLDQIKQVVIGMGAEITDSSSEVYEQIRSQVMNASSVDEIRKIIAVAQEKINEAAAEIKGGLDNVANTLEDIRANYKAQKFVLKFAQKFGQIVQSFIVKITKIYVKIVRLFF